MRSRQRKRSWQTAALVLAGLIAFAAPVAAKPGHGSKPQSSNSNPNKQRSGRQQRFEKLDKEMKSRSSRLFGTSKVILTIKPGQEANAEQEIKKLGGRVGRQLKLVDGMAAELPEPRHQERLPSARKSWLFTTTVRSRATMPARPSRSARAPPSSSGATTAPASASRSSTRASPAGTTT